MQRLTLTFDLPDELASYLDGASVAAEKAGAIADSLLGDEPIESNEAEVLLVAEEEWAGVESAPEVIAEARQHLDAVEAAGTVLP